jgi:carbamoyltransferase
MSFFVGINVQHDGGCAIIDGNGQLRVAISEERITRQKGAAGGWNALRYCLEAVDTRIQDVEQAVFSSYGSRLESDFDYGLSRFGFPPGRCAVVDHHLSHAYAAYYTSPFDDALVVVADGTGNCGSCESYYIAQGSEISRIGGNAILQNHRGIGKTYEAFASFLGWTMMESANTMALAAYGDPGRFESVRLFHVDRDQVNGQLPRKYYQGVVEFARAEGIDFGPPFMRGETQLSRDVACLIQRETERALVSIIRSLVKKTSCRNLCLAGGVALNCVSNRKIRDSCGIDYLHVVPAASDKGQCLGNALYGYYALAGGQRREFPKVDSWGKTYSRNEIAQVLSVRQELGNNFIVDAPEIRFKQDGEFINEVANRLADGAIVGWFQGGAELGPRALGHRSILCDPRRRDVVRRLGAEVKAREQFRPFAPSVLAEFADLYFDLPCESPFMLLVGTARPGMMHEIPGVVHVDGSARIQTIPNNGSELRLLLEAFHRLTNCPILLNTSFNLPGEPIVETPKDAVNAFLRCGMDVLAIESFLVEKAHAPSFSRLVDMCEVES